MLVTKAYIVNVPTEGNLFRVNVPFLNDNVNLDAEFDALVCCEPSNYNNYEVGDCVYVTFEDDLYNTAVILGKLYVDKPKSNKACGLYDSLKVSNYVELPEDTKLGKYTAKDIFTLYQKGGGGDIDEAQLKKYVKWLNTEEIDSEGLTTELFANKIQCMSGETYEEMLEEETLEENTLYFLTSAPPNEKGRE